MIYLYSQSKTIENYWQNQFNHKYGVTTIKNDFFDFDKKVTINDILILDIDQFDSIENIFNYYATIPKVLNVIALLDEPKLAHGAFLVKKGFKSYLGKKTSKIIINEALQTVINGNVWLYPQLMNYIIKHINTSIEKNTSSDILDKLTVKEQKVATLVSEGLSNKEIAQNMEIQLVTVKKHIGSIFEKLNIKDRVALAILINQ